LIWAQSKKSKIVCVEKPDGVLDGDGGDASFVAVRFAPSAVVFIRSPLLLGF
jgi:hypothetical protein